MNTAKDN